MKNLKSHTEPISKIYFFDSPHSNGHKIERFSWSQRIDEYGSIWFDFHSKTENYYANDDENSEEENEDLSDWESKKATRFSKLNLPTLKTMNL